MPDVYSIVTEQILKQMEQGTTPWRKPWTALAPANLVSKKPYRGINVFLLAYQGYGSQFWMTFNQAKQLGGTVKKGEHSTMVVFWKPSKYTKRNEETGEDESRNSLLLRYYRVFNLLQTEGLERFLPKNTAASQDPIEAADKLLAGYKNPPAFERSIRAAYSPERDTLFMPDKHLFASIQEYYSTLFHETVHSTGHPSRLDRFVASENRIFGSESYSKEELIAELGAAMLCGLSGIQNTVENSAAYLQHWMKRLKDDSKLLVQAASAAQKACDRIIGEEAKNGEETDLVSTDSTPTGLANRVGE